MMATESSTSSSTLYIGNLDENVTERILYDILIEAGRVLDLYIPKDRETNKPKGYAFAEYESEEIAEYAVKLFSGLVTLHQKTLKFMISGRDKSSSGSQVAAPVNLSFKPRSHGAFSNRSHLFSDKKPDHSRASFNTPEHQYNGNRSYHNSSDYHSSRGALGTPTDSGGRYRSRYH